MHSSEQVNRIEQLLLFSLKMATVNLTNTPSGIPEAGFFVLSIFDFHEFPQAMKTRISTSSVCQEMENQ
jgi:hypothetical protein